MGGHRRKAGSCKRQRPAWVTDRRSVLAPWPGRDRIHASKVDRRHRGRSGTESSSGGGRRPCERYLRSVERVTQARWAISP